MSAFVSLFSMRFKLGLQYRAQAWAGVATQFFWGVMMIMIYRAFYQNAPGADNGMTLPQLVTYVWLMQSFYYCITFWSGDWELNELISSGNIAYELCRPQRLYGLWFAKNVAVRLSGMLLRCVPILMIAPLLPAPYGLAAPASPAAALMFLLTISLGVCLLITYILFGCILSFYTVTSSGIGWILVILGELFSGQWLPLALFPDVVKPFVYALPFAYVNDFPFRVYNGSVDMQTAFLGLGVQLLWLLAFIAAGQWLLSRGLRRVVVQGG